MELIILIPFVISKKPVTMPLAKLVSILKNFKNIEKNSDMIFKIPLVFNSSTI